MPPRQRREDLSSASSAAEALIDNRISSNTKKRYETSLGVMKSFWDENYNGRFCVPVNKDRILSFFSWLIDTKYKDRPAASSTIRGYKSALASL